MDEQDDPKEEEEWLSLKSGSHIPCLKEKESLKGTARRQEGLLIETMTRIGRRGGIGRWRRGGAAGPGSPGSKQRRDGGTRTGSERIERENREFLFSRTAAGKISDCLLKKKGVCERERERAKEKIRWQQIGKNVRENPEGMKK